jgi:hypothetical protein
MEQLDLSAMAGWNVKWKKLWQARCRGLTPVILAAEEAEIRRIMVQSQPRKIV